MVQPNCDFPNLDGTLRFGNDFRRINEVSEFDGYPMPWVDELLDRLGRAWFISTLDLTKGYWQVHLSESAKPKTAFSTSSGHWQYRTLPFGLHGAPAMFQRMMDILLQPHQSYAAAYLDKFVIHSEAWEDRLGPDSRNFFLTYIFFLFFNLRKKLRIFCIPKKYS